MKDCFGVVTTEMYVTDDALKNSANNTVPTSMVVATSASHHVKCVVIYVSPKPHEGDIIHIDRWGS